MRKFVIFGHGHLIGDLLEIVHANGGVVTRIVQNLEETPHPTRPNLASRLARLEDPQWNPQGVNRGQAIRVIALDNFRPEVDESYFFGFKGLPVEPLAALLRARFGIGFAPLIHPSAVLSSTAQIGPGVIIHAGVIVGSGTVVGSHVMINKGAILGHDVVLDSFAVIQPGARVAGHVRVGRGCLLGMGSIVLEDLRIGDEATVAAGSVVRKSVEARTLVAGVPAQFKKRL